MDPGLSKEQVAAMAAIKWVRGLVQDYNGKDRDLKAWLLSHLEEENVRADEILGNAYPGILSYSPS